MHGIPNQFRALSRANEAAMSRCVMKKQRRVWTNERMTTFFSARDVLWGCGAVAGHSAIQAGGLGTIDVNSVAEDE
jgi:hypothetical protein